MLRDYDIFEVLPDGSKIWRVNAYGVENALIALTNVASKTKNECYAINIRSKDIIGRLNEQKPPT